MGEVKNLKKVKDAWSNVYTGLGTSKDKSIYSEIDAWRPMNKERCEALFTTDEIAKKAANLVPYDATREGVTWNMGEEPASQEVIDFLENEMGRLKVWEKLAWAWTLSRVYGGSVIILGTRGGGTSLKTPLDADRVVALENLIVKDRYEVTVDGYNIDKDFRSPNFGKPLYYNYSTSEGDEIKIHHTRIIRFDGVPLPESLFKKNDYWHDTIYKSLYTAIRNYGVTHDSIAVTLQEFNQPVFRVEGLTDAISMDQSELVLKKIELVNIMRSVARAILLDKEDEFENASTNTTGAKELVDLTVQRLVAGIDVPHTRLLGNSPTGLGGTGASELINYYDNVKSQQKVMLKDPIQRIIDLLFFQNESPEQPENLNFVFNPLFQLDREKESRSRQIQADIDETYIKTGVLSPEEITQSRFGTGRYSYETVLDDDAGDRLSSEEKAFELNAAAGDEVAKKAANGSSGEGKKLVGGKRLKPGDKYKPEFT